MSLIIWALAAWIFFYTMGRVALFVLKLIAAAVVIALIFGFFASVTGCSKHIDEADTAHDAYDTWHKGCVAGSQQWTVTQDETGQNKAFIVVCSSVAGVPSHLIKDESL
jgi:hypothetical protein